MNHLTNCLNPKQVLNKYTGQYLTVRCGKCFVCRNSRAANWVQRLIQESQNHKYTYFVTLQYDELHVPQMHILDRKDSLSWPSYFDSQTSEVISLVDVPVQPDNSGDLFKEIRYCEETPILLTLCKRDIQLFLKRLRKQFKKFNESFRFFCCGEYGPQTFRPHYHLLFFFSETLCSENFDQMCRACWQYGTVYDPHPVSGDASSYVASYVNCTSHLPQILLHKSIRPFITFSKCPPIGQYKNRYIDLRELFVTSSLSMRLYIPTSKKFDDVPLWRALQNRLFPRYPRYGSLDSETRKLLYCKVYHYFIEGLTVSEIVERIKFVTFRGLEDNVLIRYIETITHIINPKTGLVQYTPSAIESYVHACYQLYKNSLEFNIDFVTCITKVIDYYEKLQKSQFYDYLRFQDKYFQLHPVQDYLLFDSTFVSRVNGKYESDLSDSDLYILKQYKVSLNPVRLDYERSKDFLIMKMMHEKIAFDTSKSKKKNDYLLKNQQKFQNIIHYKNL